MINKSSTVYSIQNIGLTAHIIKIETDISPGLHNFSIIGLADKAVDESKDRVNSAIKYINKKAPKQQNQKIVVSLAPGNLKKAGTLFDVPIAIGYLLANQEIKANLNGKIFVGELSLKGEITRVSGIMPIIQHAKENNIKEIFIPYENIKEASFIDGITIYGCKDLEEIINHITDKKYIKKIELKKIVAHDLSKKTIRLEDIKGQEIAKRALIISAAGGHNIAFYGPPGTGKTLLANSMLSILPRLTSNEIMQVATISSISNGTQTRISDIPPIRSPHHTSSYVSIIGGGQQIFPGEISLAHKGILFLDEFPEFDRRVIESLREPLEEKTVTIGRASGTLKFPADCLLIIAFNTCPCGNTGTNKACICTQSSKNAYRRKLTGPIIDRIDIWIPVNQIPYKKLEEKDRKTLETENAINLIKRARDIQKERYEKETLQLNSALNVKNINKYIHLDEKVQKILRDSATQLGISPRSYHKIIKCAQTIADLEGTEIQTKHILEAIQYKNAFLKD